MTPTNGCLLNKIAAGTMRAKGIARCQSSFTIKKARISPVHNPKIKGSHCGRKCASRKCDQPLSPKTPATIAFLLNGKREVVILNPHFQCLQKRQPIRGSPALVVACGSLLHPRPTQLHHRTAHRLLRARSLSALLV